MLLRFLQKGLTFHNIPLMPGITAQDDENVVYSKQIGAEENNGEARRGPRARSQAWRRSRVPLPDGPTSGQVGPGCTGNWLRAAAALARLAPGGTSGIARGALLSAR